MSYRSRKFENPNGPQINKEVTWKDTKRRLHLACRSQLKEVRGAEKKCSIPNSVYRTRVLKILKTQTSGGRITFAMPIEKTTLLFLKGRAREAFGTARFLTSGVLSRS